MYGLNDNIQLLQLLIFSQPHSSTPHSGQQLFNITIFIAFNHYNCPFINSMTDYVQYTTAWKCFGLEGAGPSSRSLTLKEKEQ